MSCESGSKKIQVDRVDDTGIRRRVPDSASASLYAAYRSAVPHRALVGLSDRICRTTPLFDDIIPAQRLEGLRARFKRVDRTD